MHSNETSKIAAAYHNICDFVNNRFAVTQGQSVPEGALPTKSPKSTTFLAASNSAQNQDGT
jgi:hypothetical protein